MKNKIVIDAWVFWLMIGSLALNIVQEIIEIVGK